MRLLNQRPAYLLFNRLESELINFTDLHIEPKVRASKPFRKALGENLYTCTGRISGRPLGSIHDVIQPSQNQPFLRGFQY
jgi:hypothetical protein